METYVMRGDAEAKRLRRYHLILGTGRGCRLRCRQCYAEGIRKDAEPGTLERAISQFAGIAGRESEGNAIVNLKGGEPFDEPERLESLALSSARLGLDIHITTNGVDLAERMGIVERIRDAAPGRLRMVLSLNGHTPESDALLRVDPDNFHRTVEGASMLAAAGIPFAINTIIHRGNQDDLEGIIGFAQSLGASQINLLQLLLSRRAKQEGLAKADPHVFLSVLTRLYERGDGSTRRMLAGSLAHAIAGMRGGGYAKGCVAGYRGLLYIRSDGMAFPCPSTACDGYAAGDILDSSVEELMDSPALRRMRCLDLSPGCKGDLMMGPDNGLKAEMEKAIGDAEGGREALCIQKNF